MASAPPSFASTNEATNYARLCRLLVDVGSKALRDIFDKFLPPASLHTDLKHAPAHPTLQSLRKKRILNATQWGKLYPTIPTSVSSANFDITLLILLLRNICGLSPPASTGSWDILPPSSDKSLEANIARVKYYRNNVYGHATQASVDDPTFNVYWQDISNALTGLGAHSGASYGAAISMLKTECMDPDVEEHYRELLKEWKKDDDNTKELLTEVLKKRKMDEDSTKDKLAEMEEMLRRWTKEEGSAKDKMARIEEMLKEWKTYEGSTKDQLAAMQEILKQLRKDESSTKEKIEDSFNPAKFIDTFRELYKTREGWLAPFPWCEEFGFHLDNIFTRLKIVSRKKERGAKTDEIVNMSDIFKPHEECPRPRTVLIEGDPGMGKTTYCQKLVYDWATGRQEGSSFPKFEVVLLLKCREIKSDLWEAIDDQLLPLDVTKEDREKFVQFVRQNQSNVLLVLDGLDELPSDKLPMFKEIIQGRMLPKCHLVVTARHEAGIKVRKCCDTLLEIEGFKEEDAKQFIVSYFKTMKNLGQKLLHNLKRDESLRNLTANPLNTALLCLLCEDFHGIFPRSRTHIFLEIVHCVLRRYRRKKGLPETNEDLTEKHKAELKQLGKIALNGLQEDDMYFEASQFGDRTSDIPGFGFLSVQPGSSKRRPSLRYGFLHKSFQELFAAFYLCCQLLDGEISATSLVADGRYWSGLKQVLLFAVGMVALQSEEKAAEVIKSMVSQVNKEKSDDFLLVVLECINECKKENSDLHKQLARLCGSLLQIESAAFCGAPHVTATMTEALKTNLTIRELDLTSSEINYVRCTAMAKVLKSNSTLTSLHLSYNKIGDVGATAMAEAMKSNSTLTQLGLSYNPIGGVGATAMAEGLKSNSTLTLLHLDHNKIGDVGATAMAEVLKSNSTLTQLHLDHNKIGDVGATAMAEGLKSNSTLTELHLSYNKIGDVGATAMAEVLKSNSTLTQLYLLHNKIGDVGATAMAEGLKSNSTLTELHLSHNRIGDVGATAMAEGLKSNSTLAQLKLSSNEIGDVGATAMAEVLKSNSTLTQLDFSGNRIGDVGATAMAEVLKTHPTLTKLGLCVNNIGDDGLAALHKAVTINATIQVESENQINIDSETDGDSIGDSDSDSGGDSASDDSDSDSVSDDSDSESVSDDSDSDSVSDDSDSC